MNDQEKQAQIEIHNQSIEHLRKERDTIKDQRKSLGDELKDITEQIERQLDAIEAIRNNLPVQTLLTSDDE